MTFFPRSALFGAAILTLSACGGGSEPSAPSAENPVENREVTETSSTDTAPQPAADEPAENLFAALPAPYVDADYARGRRTFKLCQSCHTLAEGGQNLVGPNLYGIFGRDVGTVDGFAYSPAVMEADFIWTPEMLDEWLTSPRNFLPGNRMSFAGVRKPEDRLAVIAYIMLETGYAAE
ncbi:MAG: cytochrome c family protein [Henriciella sp.]|nr:cytochrome c family protein [Henriciella sp.]